MTLFGIGSRNKERTASGYFNPDPGQARFSSKRAAMLRSLAVLMLAAGVAGALPPDHAAGDRASQAAPPRTDIRPRPAYGLLDKLIRIPPQVAVLEVSSHNRKGLNGDENWPLYRDEHGDDVIFDAAGPGCIRSMWGTALDPAAEILFYFDGDIEPRLRANLIDFYSGRQPLFPAPLVSYEKRGMWGDAPYAGNCFVPIPFARSLKIGIRGKSHFFHIIYEKYPYPAEAATFTGGEDRRAVLDAFERLGERPFEYPGMEPVVVETGPIESGQSVSLLKLETASGVVRGLEIESDGGEDVFERAWLRMRWDGHLRWDVQAPTGVFFGSAVRANDVRSLPLRVERLDGGRVRLSCWFPMAFWDNAEIEWENATGRQVGPLKARVLVGPNPVTQAEGTYFTTLYAAGQTVYGRDWVLFEGLGTGWLAGVVQSMRTAHYCEGDEHFVIDGAVSPQFNGTGTEDYYLACFWPNTDFDAPFGSVAGNIQEEGGGDMAGAYVVPSSYSRFHLEAPPAFFASLDARIQHGGLSNVLSDYRSLAFCYLRKSVRLRRTDVIDVGNAASESMHGYRASEAGPVLQLAAFPEGQDFEVLTGASGRRHERGEIRFGIAVDRANRGVRLRRRIDQKSPRQKALVYVDGRYAGCWYDGFVNEELRWGDSDFEISPAYTSGKSRLNVRLEVVRGGGEGAFTDFGYEAFSYLD
jgi:hypothetical protein